MGLLDGGEQGISPCHAWVVPMDAEAPPLGVGVNPLLGRGWWCGVAMRMPGSWDTASSNVVKPTLTYVRENYANGHRLLVRLKPLGK